MSERVCDCGCGTEFSVLDDGTTPYWQHPEEGGKYFASTECRTRYLQANAHLCLQPGCDIWLLEDYGSACPAHQEQVGKMVADFEAGIPG